MEEIFVDIEGYEGKYQIGNNGSVKSLRSSKVFLKPRSIGAGKYLSVDLRKIATDEEGNPIIEEETPKGVRYKREHKEHYVHRLVAKYFVENPNPDIYTEVKHKDENKFNNNWTNLIWITTSERIELMVENSTVSSKSGHIRLSKDDVQSIRTDYKEVDSNLVADIFHVTPGYVNMIKRGKRRGVKPKQEHSNAA